MIYTVTFNPALDYTVKLEQLNLGEVNRTEGENVYFGGKGINVSVVLQNLGLDSVALGFVAGFTGNEIEAQVRAAGVKTKFIHLAQGLSRINVKIKGSKETEINGSGPSINQEDVKELFDQLEQLEDGDILVLAGAIPSALPENIYEQIMERLSQKKIDIVVDATKDLLLNVLKFHPFLIKPNNHELGEMFGVQLKTIEEIEKYARRLQEMGAQNVLISMAGDGALLVTREGSLHKISAAKGKVVNSVGAGDSMVAGFVASYSQNHDYRKALLYGSAAGSATAFSEGLAIKEKVEELFEQLQQNEKEKE